MDAELFLRSMDLMSLTTLAESRGITVNELILDRITTYLSGEENYTVGEITPWGVVTAVSKYSVVFGDPANPGKITQIKIKAKD